METFSEQRSNPIKLLNQIRNGYTKVGTFFFKHITSFDLEYIQDFYNKSLKNCLDKGLQSYEDKKRAAIEENDWSESYEKELALVPKKINSLREAKAKLVFDIQKKRIDEDIKKIQDRQKELQNTKNLIYFQSAEYYADNWSAEYQIYFCSYIDENFSKRPWDYEEFQELTPSELNDVQSKYSEYITQFSDKGIKKLSIDPFFRNLYNLENNKSRIFGDSVFDLTLYQLSLLRYARYYDGIFKNSNYIPPELLEDPDKLEEWFINQKAGDSPEKKNMMGGVKLSSKIKEKGTLGMKELNKML